MSIKELFEKIFGGLKSVPHKLYTAKNGVRNLIILIICFFIVGGIIVERLAYENYIYGCIEYYGASAMVYPGGEKDYCLDFKGFLLNEHLE
jgi:hypothetical protein